MIDYEERTNWSTRRSWFLVFILSGSLIAWAMLIMMPFVKSVPRVWNFGSVESTPSKSIYSTNNPKIRTTEKMIAPLPEGISMEEQQLQKEEP